MSIKVKNIYIIEIMSTAVNKKWKTGQSTKVIQKGNSPTKKTQFKKNGVIDPLQREEEKKSKKVKKQKKTNYYIENNKLAVILFSTNNRFPIMKTL